MSNEDFNIKQALNQSAYLVQQHAFTAKPLYSPDNLDKYNKIDPSFAERILVMAEEQNRVDIDYKQSITTNQTNVANANIRLNHVNLYLYYLFAFIMLFLSCYLIVIDKAEGMAKVLLAISTTGFALPTLSNFMKNIKELFFSHAKPK